SIKRYPVSHAEDTDMVGLRRRSDVLKSQKLVTIEDIGVLKENPSAKTPGMLVSCVVEAEANLPGLLISYSKLRINFIILLAAPQLQIDLLSRALICKFETSGYLVNVGRLPFMQRRYAAAYVRLVKEFIPFYFDMPYTGFINIKSNNPICQFLFRQHHLDCGVPMIVVGFFECFKRFLNGPEIFSLAGKRGKYGIDLVGGEKGIAFHLVTRDIKVRYLRRDSISRKRA